MHNTSASIEITVGDVQDTPPVFVGSLTGVVREDAPIGTLVMTVQARDGDKGQPRPVVYDLIMSKYTVDLLFPFKKKTTDA